MQVIVLTPHCRREVAGYCLQMAPGHTCHPLLLEGIGAQWYDWSLWPRDRPDLDVVACILAKTMAHSKIGDEWMVRECVGTSRAGHDIFNHMRIKARPSSLWTYIDWASRKPTRRSNTGRCVFRGRYLLHHWCRVQACVALSTGAVWLHAQLQSLQELPSLK